MTRRRQRFAKEWCQTGVGVLFMPEVKVLKKLTSLEEILHEGGPPSPVPLRRAAALAVIHNPFAGAYVQEIASFMVDLKPLGLEMARYLDVALAGNTSGIVCYGYAATVGAAGSIEY